MHVTCEVACRLGVAQQVVDRLSAHARALRRDFELASGPLWRDPAVVLRQAQFAVAQFLSRPGRQTALSRLVGSHDLPGTWQVAGERTWLTGWLGPPTPW